MKSRVFCVMPALLLAFLPAMPASTAPTAVISPLSLETGEVRFVGEAIEYPLTYSGRNWWVVEVLEVVSGPALSGNVDVLVYSVWEPCDSGYSDPSIEPGDEVEVYGRYDGTWVWVCESDDYYIRKAAAQCVNLYDAQTDRSEYSPGNTVDLQLGLYNLCFCLFDADIAVLLKDPTGTEQTRRTRDGYQVPHSMESPLLHFYLEVPTSAASGQWKVEIRIRAYCGSAEENIQQDLYIHVVADSHFAYIPFVARMSAPTPTGPRTPTPTVTATPRPTATATGLP